MTVLAVRNLETWYGPVNAIKGVTINVAEGRIVAVLGANGAGKTTLLNTIAGVIDPEKGEVALDGVSITGRDADAVARQGVVLVPEGRQIFPFLTVRENLAMGTFARRLRGADPKSDLEQVLTWFPRLRERMNQHAGLMSGGEQQMLAMGRALMAAPRILLLDEPSLGLSPLLTKELFAIIRHINAEKKMTILVVEQNAAIALANADSAYIMELGRIAASGQAAALMQTQHVRDSYLGTGGTETASAQRRPRQPMSGQWY
jgi:branched-chain amino acid transport system ATP-binding protein